MYIKRLLIILLMVLSANNLLAQSPEKSIGLKGAYLGQKLPGLIPKIFAPGIVSDTNWREHSQIAISPKGNEIYWSRFSEGLEQIYFTKLIDGEWSKPAVADFIKKDSTLINGGPLFSPDGKKLFYYSRNRDGGIGYIDAWYVERTENGWSEPINAGEPYNSIGDDRPPIITNNNAFNMGRNFSENKKEFIRFKYSNGKFSNPTPVNIYPGFESWWPLYISSNEEYIIFPTYTEDSFGGLDLYISFKTNEGKWGYPVNMGDKINTSLWERFPIVSPDGKYLFFMRHTNTWDIFWVSTEIIDDYKKESIEKAKNSLIPKVIKLKSEDLDKYLGVYSSPKIKSKITISKAANILKAQVSDRPAFDLDCFDKDKFKYSQGMLKMEFYPIENKMILNQGSSIYELKKE